MKKKFVSSAILAAALAVTSVVPAFAEGDTSEVYWYSDVAGYGPANWNTDSSPALDYVRDNIGLTFNLAADRCSDKAWTYVSNKRSSRYHFYHKQRQHEGLD